MSRFQTLKSPSIYTTGAQDRLMTKVQTSTSPPSTKKASIILVDDEEDLVTIFSQLLRKKGYHVQAFSNPVMALEHFRYTPTECSLLISDVRMPSMNGFQLARKVKELNPDVKIILTSAFEIKMNEFEKVLPNTQVDGFLEKPISLKKLSELVKAHIKLNVDNA